MNLTARMLSRPRADRGSQLKVAIVAETFLPAVNGVTNSVRRVAQHLVASGHEALIIAPGPGDDEADGVPVVRVPSVELPRYRELHVGRPSRVISSTLRDFRPDVVHCAAPIVLGLAGLRAARRLDIPTVAIYQTDIAGFAERYGLSLASGSLWKWLSWVHGHADLTLAPSSAAVWDLRHRGVARVARWMRGVDIEAFHPRHRDHDLRRTLARPGETIVGYVGRLAREKQVERLRPLLDIHGVRLAVVGDGPERATLEQRLPGAHFAGFRSGTELSRYVASLDVFVHTGVDETFCQAVQEALAAGVPVVAPAAGGPIDLVQHGTNGYLWTPSSPTSLIGAVDELVRSPMHLEQLAAGARPSVVARTWSSVMSELEGHYRSTLSGLAFAYAEMPR